MGDLGAPRTEKAAQKQTAEAELSSTPRHFSMLRGFTSADFLTLGNGFCGTGVVLALMEYLGSGDERSLLLAFALFPVALLLDFADGRVARWRRGGSSLGQDLDSLADVISFGVAPAALAFALGLRAPVDVCVLLYFVGCGISRLARFNATAAQLSDESGKVRYFEGLPIPTSVALVAVLFVLHSLEKTGSRLPWGLVQAGPLGFHPVVVLFFLSGSGMISKTLRIPKF